MTQNYLYFLDRIEKMDISVNELYEAIKSLCVLDITLDPKDDAQLIFESLNSTGLDLSEADKIRNFVLMNLEMCIRDRPCATREARPSWWILRRSRGPAAATRTARLGRNISCARKATSTLFFTG